MIYLQQSCSLNKNYIQRTLCEFKWYSYGMLTSQNMTPWFVSLAQGSYETVEQVIYYLIKVSYRPQHYRQRKKETEKWICITLGRQDTLFICVLHEAWPASPCLQFSLCFLDLLLPHFLIPILHHSSLYNQEKGSRSMGNQSWETASKLQVQIWFYFYTYA